MRNVLTLLGGIVIGIAIAHFWLGPIDWVGVREQTGDVISDTAAAASVRAALALQKDFELFGGIDVRAEDGTVTLSGKVASEEQRQLAGLITRGVQGVDEVVNDLEVASESDGREGTEEGAHGRDGERRPSES